VADLAAETIDSLPPKPIAKRGRRARAQKLARDAIEKMVDPTASPEERDQRRRRLTKGPTEFRAARVDQPKATLAPNQTVKMTEGTTVALDPNSSVRVVGDFKVDIPQPSKQQLQLDATSSTKELPSTQYTVFKTVAYGSGYVVTGWYFDLSDTARPYYQRCYYEQSLDQGVAATQTIAVDGSPRPLSTLAKLPFDFEGALTSCTWFAG
jgi:hypothetical protein